MKYKWSAKLSELLRYAASLSYTKLIQNQKYFSNLRNTGEFVITPSTKMAEACVRILLSPVCQSQWNSRGTCKQRDTLGQTGFLHCMEALWVQAFSILAECQERGQAVEA